MQTIQRSMIVNFKVSYFHIFKSCHLDQSLAVTGIVRHGFFYRRNFAPLNTLYYCLYKVGRAPAPNFRLTLGRTDFFVPGEIELRYDKF